MSDPSAYLSSSRSLEPWSYPTPHLTEHAQVWHTRRFAAWLLRAGAEARFGVFLSSGNRATARWSLLLEEQGVEVLSVTSDLERPLPQPLTQHRGDHFNRKLFLIEGLDALTSAHTAEERESYWRTLDGQRGQLKQRATWVTLLIQDHQTLVDAIRWAPRLMREVTRACWVWDESERRGGSSSQREESALDHVFPAQLPHRYLYQLFCAAANAGEPLEHLTLGRIFRAGYPRPPRAAHQRWQWSYRLWRGEARDPKAARFGQMGVTETLEERVTPDDAWWALVGRAEAATPARRAQWAERARDSRAAWSIDPQALLPELNTLTSRDTSAQGESERALSALRDWSHQRDGAPLPSADALGVVERLSTQLSSVDTAQRLRASITEWLTQAYAAHEDLEGCLRVNRELYADLNAWPESRFVASERALELALFCQDHAEARRLVERLEALDLELSSPHFAARHLRARSKQLGALDPSRGVWESEEAARLEERFGLTLTQRDR